MDAGGAAPRERDLAHVDAALLRLRRMWDAPAGIAHEGGVVEGSTLLVCLAVAEHPAGADGGGAGIVDVAGALGVAHSTASRLVSRAVDAGMVRRGTSPADPRRVALALTGAGARLVAASRAFRTARLGGLLAGWSDGDVAALADLLGRFAAAVVAAGPPDVPPGGGDPHLPPGGGEPHPRADGGATR